MKEMTGRNSSGPAADRSQDLANQHFNRLDSAHTTKENGGTGLPFNCCRGQCRRRHSQPPT